MTISRYSLCTLFLMLLCKSIEYGIIDDLLLNVCNIFLFIPCKLSNVDIRYFINKCLQYISFYVLQTIECGVFVIYLLELFSRERIYKLQTIECVIFTMLPLKYSLILYFSYKSMSKRAHLQF